MILHRASKAGAPHTSHRRSASPLTAVCGADLARSIPRAHRTIEAKKSHLLARGGSEILEDHHGRVPTGGSGDAPSWMRAAPAEVQSGDRGPIGRPTGERPEGEELVRGHVDLIDASAGQTPFPFHVEGRENLSPLNRMSEIRSERGEGLEDRVADLLLPIVPGRHVKSGSSERTQFTFVTTPVALIRRMRERKSGSTLSGSTRRSKVVFTSTFARTLRASIDRPSASSTPTARPLLVMMRRTSADV